MTALTKADLADHLFEVLGLSKKEAHEWVDHFFEEMRQALERGESVRLSAFGNFVLRDKASRPGRNPKTKEVALISPRRVVTFKAGQKLRMRIEDHVHPETQQSTE
ncbi:MAG: integration host factor subunit alpha [Gammaproteobacteria bacterium RIFCSPHIGHO2_12_FULL_45_9]|nr:MAG: integration host factor subunit alpha [Gammaproteobacteria bacterium RIFCSPHIGHO2_12_FULL_45_9]